MVQITPAGRQIVDRNRGRGGSGHTVKVLHIRQQGEVAAGGADSDSDSTAGVVDTAISTNRKSILCIG